MSLCNKKNTQSDSPHSGAQPLTQIAPHASPVYTLLLRHPRGIPQWISNQGTTSQTAAAVHKCTFVSFLTRLWWPSHCTSQNAVTEQHRLIASRLGFHPTQSARSRSTSRRGRRLVLGLVVKSPTCHLLHLVLSCSYLVLGEQSRTSANPYDRFWILKNLLTHVSLALNAA